MSAARLLCLPVAVASLIAGCTKSETIPLGQPAPSALYTTTRKASENPGAARSPRVDTVLSAANLLEKNADKAKDPAIRQQHYLKARMAYEQALAQDTHNRTALAGVARIHSKEGNHPRAIELFKAAIEVHPTDAELWHDLGMCFGRQRQWDEALASLHKAVSIDPHNASFSMNYGWLLARAGYYQESFDHFCRTVGEARAHYNLARMAEHQGQHDLCKQYLQAALRVDPQLAEAQQHLAAMNAADNGIKAAQFEQPVAPR